MSKAVVSAGLLACLACAASGQVLVYEGHLSPGGVGSHGAPTTPGGLTSLAVFDYTPGDGFDNDSYIGVLDSGGGLYDTDDDDGPGFLSHLDYFAPDSPNTLLVTGFGDTGFIGDHSEDFDYRAVVTVGATMSDAGGNDTFGSAQDLLGTAAAVAGSLAPGDLDFYGFSARAGSLLTFSVADTTPGDGFDNDSILGLFDSGGTMIDFDDDDGPGFLSGLHFIVPSDGTYYIAVSGFGDDGFTGDHGEAFDYVLTATGYVPAPTSAALLGLGGLLATRRRR